MNLLGQATCREFLWELSEQSLWKVASYLADGKTMSGLNLISLYIPRLGKSSYVPDGGDLKADNVPADIVRIDLPPDGLNRCASKILAYSTVFPG